MSTVDSVLNFEFIILNVHIGIDCRFWGIQHTGLGRYTRELVLAMVQLCAQHPKTYPFHFTLLFQPQAWFKDREQLTQCSILEVPIPHYSIREQFFLPSVVDSAGCQLFHFPHFNVPIWVKTPYVVTIHDLIKHFYRGSAVTTHNRLWYWIKHLGYRVTIGKAIRRARWIIVPSSFVKDQVLDHYLIEKKRVQVIYEGVSSVYAGYSRLSIVKDTYKQLLKKYGLGEAYCIYTGSMYPSKDVPTLLRALKLWNHQHPELPLYLLIACARDIFWHQLKPVVNEFKLSRYVKLPGQVPDDHLKLLYRHARAYLTASRMEGFGLPGLEAMASKCPVIAAQAGSLPEVYGERALYFAPGNVKQLVHQLETVIRWPQEERAEWLEKGLVQAAQFRWEKAARETMELYKKTLNPKL